MMFVAPLLPRSLLPARRRLLSRLRYLARAVLASLHESRARYARQIIDEHRHLLG